MNTSRIALITLLCSSLLTQNSSAGIIDTKHLTFTNGIKLSVATAFAASLITFALAEPNSDPVRYDLEEAQQAVHELQECVNVKENIQKLKKFIWFFILDGIIGHAYKKKSIRIDKDDPTKLEVHPGAYSKGLYGWIHAKQRGIFGMLTFIVGLKAFLGKGKKGFKSITDLIFHPIDFMFSSGAQEDSDKVVALALEKITHVLEKVTEQTAQQAQLLTRA